MTVSALLAASRAAHAAYRQVHADRARAQVKRMPEGWQVHLWDALHFRRQAHDADPRHIDPSWSEDKAPHEALMAFYEKQLGL